MISMNLQDALKPLSREDTKKLTRSELVELLLGEQDIRLQLAKTAQASEEERICLGDRYLVLKSKVFAPSSERKKKPSRKKANRAGSRPGKSLKPSDRYPNAEIIDQDVELDPPPPCECCGTMLVDSGMTEIRESLTVIPKKFVIQRQHLHKYSCKKCYGSLVTTPSPPRIKPGSAYDDKMAIDVAMSKYCDLIPVERYCAMAAREGLVGLPPQSLIELTHYLADFLYPVYQLIKSEVQSGALLYADETPHRMLEGDDRSKWYLWGFSTETASYFECHGTRSGDVASDFLLESQCIYLVSDVYSGYNKAQRIANEGRQEEGRPAIEPVFCNAHARRKFREMPGEDGEFFVERYEEIYRRNKEIDSLDRPEKLAARQEMRATLEEIYDYAVEIRETYPAKSHQYDALNYFVRNYEGLSRFTNNPDLPLDNNHQERLLRNPVIGRKTWYGTHSKKGARTAQILFSIVETCKLNKINPRQYVLDVVRAIHQKQSPYSPCQAAQNSGHINTS